MIGQRRQSSEEAGHLLRCLSRFVILQLDGVLCSKLPLTYLPNACHFLSKANERGLNTWDSNSKTLFQQIIWKTAWDFEKQPFPIKLCKFSSWFSHSFFYSVDGCLDSGECWLDFLGCLGDFWSESERDIPKCAIPNHGKLPDTPSGHLHATPNIYNTLLRHLRDPKDNPTGQLPGHPLKDNTPPPPPDTHTYILVTHSDSQKLKLKTP